MSARTSSVRVLWFSRAKTATGFVAQMPWLPLPELDMTGMGAPAIRASQAEDVAERMCEKILSPMMPRPMGRVSALPRQWP